MSFKSGGACYKNADNIEKGKDKSSTTPTPHQLGITAVTNPFGITLKTWPTTRDYYQIGRDYYRD